MDADLAYLHHAFRDCGIVELRHHTGDRWESGLFNDIGKFTRAVDERRHVGNLYTSLNRPDGRVASNDFGTRPLKNEDIAKIRRIVFDFDPARPTGTASTDAELRAAIRCRDAVIAALRGCGWPQPAFGMSGNGAHAVYRTNILATPDWRTGSAILYAWIQREFKDLFAEQCVLFDPVVRNPGRIWRLYGTVNRKGESTADRPHRTATIRIPSTWECVKASQIQTAIDRWTPAVVHERRTSAPAGHFRPGRGDYRTLDVVRWFAAHGLYRRHIENHVHAVVCPWRDEHTAKGGITETVIFEGTGGWPGFHCHHAHCAGRGIRDVMALFGDADAFCLQQREVRRGR